MALSSLVLLVALLVRGAGGLRSPFGGRAEVRAASALRMAFNYDPWSLSMGRNASHSLPVNLEPVIFPIYDEKRSGSALQGPSKDPKALLRHGTENAAKQVRDKALPKNSSGKTWIPIVHRQPYGLADEAEGNRSLAFPLSLKEAARLQRTNEQLRARLAYLESRISMLENQLKLQRISRAKLSGGELDEESKELALLVAPGLPEQEQLLLGCTAAGALAGLMVGNVLQHTVLWMRYIGGSGFVGAIAGAVLAVYYSNRDDGPGNLSRAAGKLVVLASIRSIALASDVSIILRLLWQRLALVEKIRRAGYALRAKLAGLGLWKWRRSHKKQEEFEAQDLQERQEQPPERSWPTVKLFHRPGGQATEEPERK